MFCQMFATLSTSSYGRGAWHMRMHEDICVLQHTLRQMSARRPHPNRGRWHTSRRWWITRTQNTRPSKVSIVIFCHLFSHGTKRHNLTFYGEFATNCTKRTYLTSLIEWRFYCVDSWAKQIFTHIAQALLLTQKSQKAELTHITQAGDEQFSRCVPRAAVELLPDPSTSHPESVQPC